MPSLGGINISGDGQYVLNSWGIYVTSAVAFLSDPTKVQLRSQTLPRRLMHGGYVALGFSTAGGDVGTSQVSWYRYFEFEAESWPVPDVFADTVYWHIPLGVEWYLDLYWA